MPLLASTYAYTFGLNAVKRAWAFQPEDGSQHLDIVARCCAIKVSKEFHFFLTIARHKLQLIVYNLPLCSQ